MSKTVHVTRGKNRLFCGRKIGKKLTNIDDAAYLCIPCVVGLRERHNEYAEDKDDLSALVRLHERRGQRQRALIEAYERVFTLIGVPFAEPDEDEPEEQPPVAPPVDTAPDKPGDEEPQPE